MDQSLLKSCLSYDFYNSNKAKLRPTLFDDSLKDIYKTLVLMHDKFQQDISPLEMFSFWKSQNPTSTASWDEEIQGLVNSIAKAEILTPVIATDVIENLWRQSIGLDIADLGIKMSEGDVEAMDHLDALLKKVSGGYAPNNFQDAIVTDDIYEMLAAVSDENKFKFNIETLSRHVYGIGRGDFGVIAAYSNVGKTAFAISLCASPGGFCEQGAKVGYIANEEIGKKTKLRAIQAYCGLTKEEVAFDPRAASARYLGIKDRLIFVDAQDWTIQDLDGFLTEQAFDVVLVDMGDKISLTTQFASGHERLRFLYYRLRELAKAHNIALVALSQCSHEAEGKTRITMSMLEGSKLGKAAESDIMLGIGKTDDPNNPDEPTRYINVMKNKISGWHGTVICNLDGATSRYGV
jgi:replicative DNA helicase|tara:strand:- start:112 stop:1329 length:1218 start_codon:yes stop_codon:yes gene_type:complete